MGGDEDDSILARLRRATTVPELLDLLRQWYNWGAYDTTGAQILVRLGEIGRGDPDAIAALKRSSKGQIARTSSAASSALSKLANLGDALAVNALREIEAERLADEAARQGISVEELQQRKAAAAQLRRGGSASEASEFTPEQRARNWQQHSQQQYGESQFQVGQRVVCLIEGWDYTGQISVVERAVNRRFVAVRFSDGYLTIQGDDKFSLVSD